MLDRFGKEVDFSELFMEETLSAKDKKNIPDDQWGLIIKNDKGEIVERKFPLNDERHVKQAAIMFNRAKGLTEDQKRELARNIVRRAKELDMDYSGWESLKPYLDKSVKESFIPDPDSTTGTSDFDESRDDPDDCFCESFEEIFGPVIQEAFDAITGEEIPIDKAYTLEEMKARSYTDKDVIIPVKKPPYDELYFGSPVNYMPEIDLQGPLFVTPFKGLASIFTGRERLREELRKRGIRRYNLDYKEWDAPEKYLINPLKEVHVYVEPYPELEPFVLEEEGFIHCVKTKDYENNFYKYPWMNDREYLIAKTDNIKVEFTRVIKCKIKYIVSGRMSGDNDFNKVSDDPLKWAENISKEISSQVKKDEKPPVGNQNCQLCSWCVEASFRGWIVMPRPVYSPRDPIFTVKGEDIVIGTKRERVTSFDDLDDLLRDAGRSLARWYCHVNWKDSKGGHEFIILKVTDTRNTPQFFIVDAQIGKVERLSASHEYFRDINWSTSYIARLDKYEFNRKLLEKMNNPSMIVPWDEKKDIAFMMREGMISKEESESLKKNAFEIAMSKPVQESAIGEILNGVNPFSNKRVFHISLDGHLDGQVFKPRVPEYLDKYDPSQDKFEDVENPRVCFSPSIEGCLNAIMVTIGRWKTAEKLREWYVYVPEKPLKEYKHRTNKQLIKEKKVYDANVTDEIWIEEPVRLKQYGIIRIDQVSSKSIKDTVPTTKGFTGHRYKYSFKWHWLVKPKVIADLPYDYSPMEVCKDMIADMEKFKYGLAENGTVHSASAHDYDTKYKLQSPEEFEQNGGGICYDYVEFMEGYLNAYGYDCKKYFISTNTEDNDTHTFLLVRDGKGWKDGFIYPESSFKLMEGVYEVKNYEEAALKIMDKIFDVNHNGEKYDEIKYYVWEYSGHPPYGSDMETCMKYFSKGDPIHEGTAMKLKRKD